MKGKAKQRASRLTRDLKKVYGRRHLCVGCGKPIEVGQTWKFTPEGRKVHYHCVEGNPSSVDYDWTSREAANYLDSLTDAQLSRRLDTVGSQIDYMRGAGTETIPEYRRAAFINLQNQEQAIIDARLRKFDRKRGHGNPAGPTFSQALVMARQAGAKIGDTSGFTSWLVRAKLDNRSPQVQRLLQQEFWRGVEEGAGEPVGSTSGSLAYKGATIHRVHGGWTTSLDPDTIHDTPKDAKRFVDAQRNPESGPPRYVPAEDDWPIGPIKWTVMDTRTGHKVATAKMWIRVRTRQAAENIADRLNRKEQKGREA